MYTQEQYEKVLSLYDKCGSVTKTITQLGIRLAVKHSITGLRVANTHQRDIQLFEA